MTQEQQQLIEASALIKQLAVVACDLQAIHQRSGEDHEIDTGEVLERIEWLSDEKTWKDIVDLAVLAGRIERGEITPQKTVDNESKQPWEMSPEEYQAFKRQFTGRAPRNWRQLYENVMRQAVMEGNPVAEQYRRKFAPEPYELTSQEFLRYTTRPSDRLLQLRAGSEIFAVITYPQSLDPVGARIVKRDHPTLLIGRIQIGHGEWPDSFNNPVNSGSDSATPNVAQEGDNKPFSIFDK